MKKWKDLKIGTKLRYSYLILICIFFAGGIYTITSLINFKNELRATSEGYLPLVENTNKIERLTNQVLQFLWQFTVLGNKEYYDLGKSSLKELYAAQEETKMIINNVAGLNSLNVGLVRIGSWTRDLETIIDQSLEVLGDVNKNKENFKSLSSKFAIEAKNILYKGENKLRNELNQENIPGGSLYNRHRKNRIINLILDKENNRMLNVYEAISKESPDLLSAAFKESKYMVNLLNLLDSLASESFETEGIKKLKGYSQGFSLELYDLKNNLIRSRELSVRRTEIASVVIYEAALMGQDGIKYAGETLKENYRIFSRSVPVYLIGLSLSLVFTILFSILITRSITSPMNKIVSYAEDISRGNLDASIEIAQKDEMGRLAGSLLKMSRKLKANIRELKKVERGMLSISIETEEREKKRMAEDLHDSLSPQLSIIKLYIDALKNTSQPEDKRKMIIDNAESTISEAIALAKQISFNLLPNLLSDFGLERALQSFCSKVNEISPVTVNFISMNYPSGLDRNTELMLFRVVKELINNTLRHANAKNININLSLVDEILLLEYHDDGKGFEIGGERDKESRGLSNIQNRIQYLSGNIKIESKPGEGMHVLIDIEMKILINDS